MSLIAVVDVSHPDLALTETIHAAPAVTIRVVPHSGTDPDTGMFFFLVESETGAFSTFESALEADPTVAESLLVSETETTRIYRLRHTPGTKLITPETSEVGGLMLEAESTRTGWRVRLGLPDRESVSTLWNYCEAQDISFEVEHLYRQDDLGIDGEPNLTDAQRVALLTAFKEGYFEEPRGTTLEELAELLDLSPTAVGGRIRRGTERLVAATLADE